MTDITPASSSAADAPASSSAHPHNPGDVYVIDLSPKSYKFPKEDYQLLYQEYQKIHDISQNMFEEIHGFLIRHGESSYVHQFQSERDLFKVRLLKAYDNNEDGLKRFERNRIRWDLLLFWKVWDLRISDILLTKETFRRKMEATEKKEKKEGQGEPTSHTPLLEESDEKKGGQKAVDTTLVEEVEENWERLRLSYQPIPCNNIFAFTEFDFPSCVTYMREEKRKVYVKVQDIEGCVIAFDVDQPINLVVSSLEVLSMCGMSKFANSNTFRSHLLKGFKQISLKEEECSIVELGEYKVKTFFGEWFRGLRHKFGIEDYDFIRSLSLCKEWNADGGKSKAFFFKTEDETLVVKGIKKIEFEHFLQIGEDYFAHFAKEKGNVNIDDDVADEAVLPSLLAKIFGVYEVSSKETTQYILVMENTFFGRKVDITYDIKGATLGRNKKDAELVGGVRLDSNFRDDIRRHSLVFDTDSKKLLEEILQRDTEFLRLSHIVDYSVLFGFNVEKKLVTCAIIDFLRPYTCDKRCESVIKHVMKRKAPTIVSPQSSTSLDCLGSSRLYCQIHPPLLKSLQIQTSEQSKYSILFCSKVRPEKIKVIYLLIFCLL